MAWFDQSDYDVRFEWGLEAAKRLSPGADVTVVVDVLSFSTCVEIACSRGAVVYPYIYKDDRAQEFAKSVGAKCASPKRSKTELCLSPNSLAQLSAGEKVVLPSPNGSTICFSIEKSKVICGSLRNARAVAERAKSIGKRILVIAAGEQWEEGKLRPAIEDMIGAGAILKELGGKKSPEAEWAIQSFKAFEKNLAVTINGCASGRELVERGFPEDVDCAIELNVSQAVPVLKDGYFVYSA